MISAVIPTYRRQSLLVGRALTSVLDQTVPVDEILIVHDGDDPGDIVPLRRALASFDDPRIALIPITRQQYPDDPQLRWCLLGLDARNRGLDEARGDLIAPLDDDDEWTVDHVERLLRGIEDTGVDFVYGVSRYHWPDGRAQMAGSWPPGMGAFCDGAQLYRASGWRYDPGCVDRGLPEDGDLWTRMYASGEVEFAFTPHIVHHYYPNPR